MRCLLTSLAIAAVCLGVGACADTYHPSHSTSTSSASTPGTPGHPETFTTTPSGVRFDQDDASIRFYGHQAGAPEQQAITTLIERYYAAAAQDDGARACRLVHSLIAETIPEQDEVSTGKHETCAIAFSLLLRRLHKQRAPESATAKESATLKVIGVRVDGDIALALLRFGKAPEPDHITVHLEGRTWKIWELFGHHMP